MKAQIGVDDKSSLVHHVECTAANEADLTQIDKLLHGKKNTICGDIGYSGAQARRTARVEGRIPYCFETIEVESEEEQAPSPEC